MGDGAAEEEGEHQDHGGGRGAHRASAEHRRQQSDIRQEDGIGEERGVRGDELTQRHAAEEAVKGVVRNGKAGAFAADIPLFSARAFLHRGVLKGHHIAFRVKEWEADDKLHKLVLEPEKGFPTKAPQMHALYRGSVYPVKLKDGLLHAMPRPSRVSGFLQHRKLELDDPWEKAPDDWTSPEQFRTRTGFGAFVRPVMAHALGGTRDFHKQVILPPTGKDHIQLFIVARSPEGFHAQGKRLGKRKGFVVYHVHLFEPENPDGRPPAP
ncbi:hypothetical protein ACFL09_06995 [Planctomycetota bacterium]